MRWVTDGVGRSPFVHASRLRFGCGQEQSRVLMAHGSGNKSDQLLEASAMKSQRVLFALTALNLLLLLSILFSPTAPALASTGISPLLRGRALEIVDDQGRVRASIKLHPAQTFKPTGRRYPETVMLRLIDPQGRP